MKALFLSPLLISCHVQRELPRPDDDPKTASILMLALDESGVQWATAFDLAGGYPLISWRGDVELIALEYGCPIERLGLVSGRQPLLQSPAGDTRLPPARRILSLAGESTVWEVISMSERIDAALRSIDLPADNRCASYRAIFEPRHLGVPLDGHLEPTFVLPYDEESTLVGSRNGMIYRVHRGGEIDRVPALDGYLGAWKSPTGELWMMSDRGVLARGTIDGLTAVSSTSAFGDEARRIALAGPTDPSAPFELYASARIEQTDKRAFVRFDGVEWHGISRAGELDSIFYPATVWLGERRAIAIGMGLDSHHVVRFEDGTITSEPLPTDSGLSSMIQHPVLGTLVGGDNGTIVRYTSEWEPVIGGPRTMFVRTLAPLGDGFIFGSSDETNFHSYRFRQWFPEIGFCEKEELTPESVAALYLGALGEDALLAATVPGFDLPFGLTILELVEPAGTCSRD